MNIDIFEKIMYIISQCNCDKFNVKVIEDKLELSSLLKNVDNSRFKNDINNPNILIEDICLYHFSTATKIIGYKEIEGYDSCKKIIIVDKDNNACIEMKCKTMDSFFNADLIDSRVSKKVLDIFGRDIIVDTFSFYVSGDLYLDLQQKKDFHGNLLSEQLKFKNRLISDYQYNSNLNGFYESESQLEMLYKDEVPVYSNVNINGLSSDSMIFAKLCMDTINTELIKICRSLLYMFPIKYTKDNKSDFMKLYYLKKRDI